MIGYFKRPRAQDFKPGDRLPAEAGGVWFNRCIAEVFHGHYPFWGNYVRFTLVDGGEVEFVPGRSWRRALGE